MVPTVSVLMITHMFEVIVWSLAYWIVDAAPPGANLVYFAFVNYTTLGYGDVLPVRLASAWPDSCDERCVVIRMVDCDYF